MTPLKFQAENAALWAELEAALQAPGKGQPPTDGARLASMYRRVCEHLALAQARAYPIHLTQRLETLTQDAHRAISFALWFAPQGTSGPLFSWFTQSQSPAISIALALVYAAAVLAVEPFYVAAGFAMYLNHRVELEAWDVEQEFRRAFGN